VHFLDLDLRLFRILVVFEVLHVRTLLSQQERIPKTVLFPPAFHSFPRGWLSYSLPSSTLNVVTCICILQLTRGHRLPPILWSHRKTHLGLALFAVALISGVHALHSRYVMGHLKPSIFSALICTTCTSIEGTIIWQQAPITPKLQQRLLVLWSLVGGWSTVLAVSGYVAYPTVGEPAPLAYFYQGVIALIYFLLIIVLVFFVPVDTRLSVTRDLQTKGITHAGALLDEMVATCAYRDIFTYFDVVYNRMRAQTMFESMLATLGLAHEHPLSVEDLAHLDDAGAKPKTEKGVNQMWQLWRSECEAQSGLKFEDMITHVRIQDRGARATRKSTDQFIRPTLTVPLNESNDWGSAADLAAMLTRPLLTPNNSIGRGDTFVDIDDESVSRCGPTPDSEVDSSDTEDDVANQSNVISIYLPRPKLDHLTETGTPSSKPSLYRCIQAFDQGFTHRQGLWIGAAKEVLLLLSPLLFNFTLATLEVNFQEFEIRKTDKRDDYTLQTSIGLAAVLVFTRILYTTTSGIFYAMQHVNHIDIANALSGCISKKMLLIHLQRDARAQVSDLVLDAERLATKISLFYEGIMMSVRIFFSFWLLYTQVSFSFLAGLGVAVIFIPSSQFFAKKSQQVSRQVNRTRKFRVKLIYQLARDFSSVKASGMEGWVAKHLLNRWNRELFSVSSRVRLDGFNRIIWLSTSFLFISLMFIVHVMRGGAMSATIVFTSIAVCSILVETLQRLPDWITDLIETRNARSRLEAFLSLPECRSFSLTRKFLLPCISM
jgi:hypothetical protein